MPGLTLEPQLGRVGGEQHSRRGSSAAKAWRPEHGVEIGVEIGVTDAEREGGTERRAEVSEQCPEALGSQGRLMSRGVHKSQQLPTQR